METQNEILRTDDIELSELSQFTGTENYYGIMGARVTDGVEYVMRNGYSWIVTDFLVIAKMKLKEHEFLSMKLKLLPNTANKAQMVVTDGNNKVLYKQNYEYTDAKREVDFYFTDNVLMLTGEY